MRITRRIRMRMMDAMCYDPVDGTAFERERAADSQKVLNELWRLVATMSQESVKTHADSQARRNPPEQDRDQQRLPLESEERDYRSEMKEP